MSLTKLHLFTKNTDATATEQGFYFQKLITLRSWLLNRLKQNDVAIFCDYEEDVFERSHAGEKSTFRQVKLYSDNFSFSKEEITKSISHFFMLYCKGDYVLDDVTFIFETNSGVANQYKTEDPKLLREWWENQDALSEELLIRCRKKVKSLIDQYITDVITGKLSDEMFRALKEAKVIYDNLPEDVWNGFIKSIRWKFDSVSHDLAIPQLILELEKLVVQLPLPLDSSRASSFIAILLAEIAARTAEKDPKDKVLTKERLDILLLNIGSKEDRWYAELFEKWEKVEEIAEFNVGEFYEIVAAARHCRWRLFDTDHDQLWLKLLMQYIGLSDTIVVCRRKAIYEYIFLLLSPNPETYSIKNNIDGTQDLLRYYFENVEERNSFSDVENDITLLEITKTQLLFDPNFILQEKISNWTHSLFQFIEHKIIHHHNIDELCLAYQMMGHFHFHKEPARPLLEKTIQALEFYNKIPVLLPKTQTYSIATLNSQTSKILDLLIKKNADVQAIQAFEEYLFDIEEYALITGQSREAARSLVQRSASYISKPSVRNYLKALTCLHKAKDYCNNDDSRPELIIVLINISKVYSALGMNMAAKYFGLTAVWASVHFGDHTIFKLISNSYAAVFHADFQQGAWVSALDDFQKYIVSRMEFRSEPLDLENDKVLTSVLLELSLILVGGAKVHPEMQAFIQYQKQEMGWIYTDFIDEIDKSHSAKFEDEAIFKNVLQSKLAMVPFSDVGPQRKIAFETLGIKWNFIFENSSKSSAISEEFVALLQITLCEIGLMEVDLHLIEMPVTIKIGQADEYTQSLTQHITHDEAIWNMAIPALEVTDQKAIQFHYAFIATLIKTLLSYLSVLPSTEFYEVFDALYQKQKLGSKGLIINAYQRVYFNLLTEEQFSASFRSNFNPVIFHNFTANMPGLYMSFDGLSPKYDQASSLEKIAYRYINTYEKLSLSLEIWKQDSRFKILVDSLRASGWLDWQILHVLMNFVINTKVNILLEKNPPISQDELQTQGSKLQNEMRRQTEIENYIPIPVAWLLTDQFLFYMDKMPVDILHSFGLENGMKHPTFNAVRTYLAKRFAFATDDVYDSNVLKDF